MSRVAEAVLDPGLEHETPLPPSPPAFGDGPIPPGGRPSEPPVSNARIGMLAFIVFESMLFAGLLGGFVILRFGSAVWPPAGQPYLPIAITWLNTALLLGSCVPLYAAVRALRRGQTRRGVRALALASALGATFLAVQGFEWVRLLAHGLTVSNGVYGASFLLLIGMHGIHVLGAVVWLGVVTALVASGKLERRASDLREAGRPEKAPGAARRTSTALDLISMYWTFVCIVWVALFALVYLA